MFLAVGVVSITSQVDASSDFRESANKRPTKRGADHPHKHTPQTTNQKQYCTVQAGLAINRITTNVCQITKKCPMIDKTVSDMLERTKLTDLSKEQV